MRRTEIEAVGELAGEALAAGGGLIREMHLGIASRPFGILGPAAKPVRVIHDGVSDAVYEGVRRSLRAGARGSLSLLSRRAGESGPRSADTPAGAFALSVLNGLYGDHLDGRGNGLALGMDLHVDAGEPTPRLAVFVHGLFENHDSWHGFPRRPGRTYGERLRDDLGFTAVHVHYNTGLQVERNGRELAQRLDALVDGWPVEVEEIVLVGHSMGGLVARTACHHGGRWSERVRHVFCLGTPHLGADIAKGLDALGRAFGRLPETRALGMLLDARSTGIKDLRDGSDCPFLPCAAYYFVAATLREGPVGNALGDLLVRIPSASGRGNGRGRHIPFEVDNGLELTGLTHFDLLNHPAVYDQLRGWIATTA